MTTSDTSTELRFEAPGPGSWEQDPVHFPRPMTRYFQETHPPSFKRGTNDFARFCQFARKPYWRETLAQRGITTTGCEGESAPTGLSSWGSRASNWLKSTGLGSALVYHVWYPLEARLAKLGVDAGSWELRYAGDRENVLRPLSAAAMIGLLAEVVGSQAVNFVNALHLANARGLQLKRVRTGRLQAYGEYVEVGVSGNDWDFRVAGALLAEGHPRLVKLGDYHVEIVPHGLLIILRNHDVPGVIGRVGTLLGEAGVNIAEYHQSRHESGNDALAAIRVEGDLDEAVIGELQGITDVVEVFTVDLRD